MKANIFRKTLSLLLALALLAGCTSAWATTEVIVNATDTDQKDVEIEEIEIKETTPEYEDTNGLFVTADNGHEADVEVEEGVSAEGGAAPGEKTIGTEGVWLQAGDGATVDVEIGEGGVTAQDANSATGVEVDVTSLQDDASAADGEAHLKVEGDVTAIAGSEGERGDATGVSVEVNQSENGKAEVEIDGDVIATGTTGAWGMDLRSEIGGSVGSTVDVHVEGDVTAAATEYEYGATAVLAENMGERDTVTVDGSVTAESPDQARGVVVNNAEDPGLPDGTQMEVSVDGNVTADGGIGAAGIEVVSSDGNTQITAGGDVTAATEKGDVGGVDIRLASEDGGTVSVTVGGTVEASVQEQEEGYQYASGVSVDMGGSNNSSVTVEIGGDVVSEADRNAVGVISSSAGAIGEGNSADIHVKGDVEATTTGEGGNGARGVSVEDLGGTTTVTVDGSVTAEAKGEEIALAVSAVTGREGEKAVITVGGDVKAAAGQHAAAVEADSYAGEISVRAGSLTAETKSEEDSAFAVTADTVRGTVTVESEGDITVTGGNRSAAVYAGIEEGGSLTVRTGGGINVSDNRSGSAVELYLEGGKAEVDVAKDVESDHSGILLKSSQAEEKSEMDAADAEKAVGFADEWNRFETKLLIDGEWTDVIQYLWVMDPDTGTQYSFTTLPDGTLVNGSKIEHRDAEAEAKVNVGGNLLVDGGKEIVQKVALDIISTNEESVTEVNIGGDVAITDGSIAVHADNLGGIVKVKTGGDVSSLTEGASTNGIVLLTGNNSSTEVEIGGEVLVSAGADGDEYGKASGVFATAEGGDAKVKVTVEKGITVESLSHPERADAIRAVNDGEDGKAGQIDIRVNSDVSSTGSGIALYGSDRDWIGSGAEVKDEEFVRIGYGIGESHEPYEMKIYYNEEGGYYYDQNGSMWTENEPESGLTRIEIKGGVEAGGTGLLADNAAPADVIIDGTLEGGEHAVVLTSETVADNLTLTVWEIKKNEDGSVAEMLTLDDDGEKDTEEYEEFEKEIQYIIRLEQPEAGARLSTEGTYEYEGYNVAHEDDTVILKINLEPGYEITGAFGDVDQEVRLLRDANGDYYLVVPRGGAVQLSVTLRKIEEEKKAGPRQENLPVVSISLDPNGGILNGKTDPVVKAVTQGRWFNLPAAPEKEGSEFIGWYGTEYPATDSRWSAPAEGSSLLLKEKARVQAVEDYFYTAVWKNK